MSVRFTSVCESNGNLHFRSNFMKNQSLASNCRFLATLFVIVPMIIWLYHIHPNDVSPRLYFQAERISVPIYLNEKNDSINKIYGWQPVGNTYEEQKRLHDMSIMVSSWHSYAYDNVPTVPSLSADGHLLVLSAAASRVRYGNSLTFIMVYPTDVKTVLPKGKKVDPVSAKSLNLWCLFTDGSVTPAYSYDSRYGNDRASLLDCALSSFAYDRLWRRNETLQVYLVSLTDKDRSAPILKAYVTSPQPATIPLNMSQQQITLCTSPLQNGGPYLTQWIMFHYLVGFRKFAVYNTTDNQDEMKHSVDAINRQYPNLVDVVQWNFSSLALEDVLSTRYFQTEALHDCLIRYGDHSEWLGMLDLDEYIVPLPPYETVLHFLNANYGRRIMGSVNLWSQFFCTEFDKKYSSIESNQSLLVIERFTFRASALYKDGREKYLYRPRFIQYLSIHHQIVGLAKEEPPSKTIMLAHYATMAYMRLMPTCSSKKNVADSTVRDRFASKLKKAIESVRS